MDEDDISDDDYRALHEFRFALRRFLRFSEEAARAAGLEPQQHQAMLAIRAAPPGGALIGYVAERLQIRHHSAVELVDRLVAHGFAERHRAEADRRNVVVNLTPQGEDVLRKLSLHHRAELRAAGPALTRLLDALIKGRPTTAAEEALRAKTAVPE